MLSFDIIIHGTLLYTSLTSIPILNLLFEKLQGLSLQRIKISYLSLLLQSIVNQILVVPYINFHFEITSNQQALIS